MIIDSVIFRTGQSHQFSLKDDPSDNSYAFQDNIKWWQFLLNHTLAKIFSSLKTVAVEVTFPQKRRIVFISNRDFIRLRLRLRLRLRPRPHAPSSFLSKEIEAIRVEMTQLHKKIELSLLENRRERPELSESVAKLFKRLNVPIDLPTLESCLSTVNATQSAELVASALQNLLANPKSPEAADIAIKVKKRVAIFFKRNLHNKENFVVLFHLYKQLRRQIKVLTKPKRISENQEIRTLMQLTWLHGTKASVLKFACNQTERTLLPSGELKKRRLTVLTGEMERGSTAFGINSECISGVPLRHATTAIQYAHEYPLNAESERKLYESLLQKERPTDQEFGYESFLDRGYFTRQVEAFRRIKRLNPELVQHDLAAWKAKVEDLYQDFNTYVLQKRPKEVYAWHDSHYTSQIYSFISSLDQLRIEVEQAISNTTESSLIATDKEDLALAKIPVVFGSNTIYGKPVRFNVQIREEEREETIASAELGRDIQYAFTPQEHVKRIQSLVRHHGLSIQVLDIEQLRLASTTESRNLKYLWLAQ